MASKLTKNLGMLLLGLWLIMNGLMYFFNLSFNGIGAVMAVLAIASGILVIIGR